MKNFFLTAFLASLLFTSCSSDDDSASGTVLYKTVNTNSYGGKITTLYENGYKISTVDSSVKDSIHYTYDPSGNLISAAEFNNNSANPIINNYVYDNMGRLIQIVQEEHLSTFTYDDINKTINSSLFFNDEGKIYRDLKFENYTNRQVQNEYRVTFDAGLPVEIINTRTTWNWNQDGQTSTYLITYEYDNDHDPSLLGLQEEAFEINSTLISGFNTIIIGRDFVPYTSKYITKITTEYGETIKFYYEFDDNGLPIKVNKEYNGQIVGETVYYYR